MKKVLVALVACALVFAGCTGAPGGDESPAPTAAGSVPPLIANPGLASLGLELATVSVEAQLDAWMDDATGLTHVLPADDEAASVTVVRVAYDGTEQWRDTIAKPESASHLYPRMSKDEALGVVSVWFTDRSTGDTVPVVGDIHWFDIATGERGRISPRRVDSSTRIETWNRLVGYVTYATSGSDSTSFTHLDSDREEHTSRWDEVLRAGEHSWLSNVVDGRPTFSVRNEDDVVLRHGLNVLVGSGNSRTIWHALDDGTHGVVNLDGTKFLAVGPTGEILLDYDGECRVDTNRVRGVGTQLWSGALFFDHASGEYQCLSALGELRGSVMGMTPSGVALALGADGRMVFSEPSYNTVIESDLEAMMWPRGEYLVVADYQDERRIISVFNASELRLR